MAKSLSASLKGLEIVEQARKKKGWTRTMTVAWWQAALTSQATLKRFWRRESIQQESFIRICEAVGLSNWQEISDNIPQLETQFQNMTRIDWGEAPDICTFYGRTEELLKLEKWIVVENCRLVALLGMGGIGKTALSVTLADSIQNNFKCIIWRSLRYSPTVEELLRQLLKFLGENQSSNLIADFRRGISQLIEYLRSHRCLLILDNIETILRPGQPAGYYREGYEGYGELIKRLAEERHQSCLLLISREKPKEITYQEETNLSVRSLTLTGLQKTEAAEIFQEKGLADQEQWQQLFEVYKTNPLVLKLLAALIQELFNGKVAEFLKYNTIFLVDNISNILDQQFERLSALETEVMQVLATKRQPLSITELRQYVSEVSASTLMATLESLGRRSLIEKIVESELVLFTLQPVMMKYVNNRINSH